MRKQLLNSVAKTSLLLGKVSAAGVSEVTSIHCRFLSNRAMEDLLVDLSGRISQGADPGEHGSHRAR